VAVQQSGSLVPASLSLPWHPPALAPTCPGTHLPWHPPALPCRAHAAVLTTHTHGLSLPATISPIHQVQQKRVGK
jgi:hypothetical protein